MKRVILFGSIIVGCLMLTAASPAPSALAADEVELMPMELDGTEWAIEIVSINKKGAKETEEDTLLFKDKKFISKNYEKKGYKPTNYSLTISKDDVTSFGTMQIREKDKETSFWRGTVTGEKIDGSLHIQHPKQGNVTLYFTGKLSNGALKRREDPNVKKAVQPNPPPAPPVIQEEAVQPIVEDIEQTNRQAEEL